jgi:hypothetical protein
MAEIKDAVWVFHGEGAQFACAVFRTKDAAVGWIGSQGVSGVLTAYPVDVSAYEWAVQQGFFKANTEEKRTPKFIERFTSASQEHFHFQTGKPR